MRPFCHPKHSAFQASRYHDETRPRLSLLLHRSPACGLGVDGGKNREHSACSVNALCLFIPFREKYRVIADTFFDLWMSGGPGCFQGVYRKVCILIRVEVNDTSMNMSRSLVVIMIIYTVVSALKNQQRAFMLRSWW